MQRSGFSALTPKNVSAYQTITINSEDAAEDNSHFLYQRKIPRIGDVITSCTSAVNVVVYKSITDTTKIPKWVVYTQDTLYLYADISVSTSQDSSYIVGYGLKVNEPNSTTTFTNCGVTAFYGFNESVDGATTLNYATGNSSVVAEPVTLGSAGKFGYSGLFGNTGVVTTPRIFNGLQKFTLSMIVNFTNTSTTSYFVSQEVNASISFRILQAAGVLYFDVGLADVWVTHGITSGAYGLVTYVYDGTLTGNENRVKVFINGVQKTGHFTNTFPATTQTIALDPTIGKATTGMVGKIDEFMLSTNILSPVSRYNQLFAPATFSTLGEVVKISTSTTGANRWGAYRKLNLGQGMH
jgi:hypothetical protein